MYVVYRITNRFKTHYIILWHVTFIWSVKHLPCFSPCIYGLDNLVPISFQA